ncbi:uncharacterized lipoprotein YddW (UPF0748 family) [Naumannella cuiyingiana]|uniref:Uncharacterized lipoprotein YddW (UPF0748 family) n=1 Tax=Naumannella cuiyingiana TaxID=1347891 RepID=A0A7Z0D8J6_9ACTN|nr:family 10 glycosylhydrolase [Naumannella cuiyingiana]NYI70749.1 uncharacterized lipoprotein YddW (UPF0748 family) [Naumannella cuiyingiana]
MAISRRTLLTVPVAAAAMLGAQSAPARAATAQLRGLWIASVANIDWPSRTGLSAAEQRRELLGWLDLAKAHNLNAIALQVRPTADSFWPGAREPWSRYLTGTQGRDPGWDPLGTAVAEAHRRGLQLHAWFNPYRVAMTDDISTLVSGHPARRNPSWVERYGGKLYYNPGVPEARRFVIDAIVDAVRRYPIDAVHFDDYFYPYPVAGQTFDDRAEYQAYADHELDLAGWRRANITTLITELRTRIRATRPGVRLGISPFGVWRNRSTDPAGSDTRAGVQTYDDLYADTRGWVRRNLIDYIAPQVYWSRGFAAADYAKLVPWWSSVVAGTNVRLYIGQAAYKVGADADPNWSDPAELSSHLDFNRGFPAVRGDLWFSARNWRADRLGSIKRVREAHYRTAVPPA